MELLNKMKKWSVEKRRQDLLTTQIIASALSICGRDVADAEAIENNLRRVYGPDGRRRRSADDDTDTDEEDEDSDSNSSDLEDEYSDESDY